MKIILSMLLILASSLSYAQKSDTISNMLDKYFTCALANKEPRIENVFVSLDKHFKTELILENKSIVLQLSLMDSIYFPLILKKANDYSLYPDIRARTASYFIYQVFYSSNYINKEMKKFLISKSLLLSESVSTSVYNDLAKFDSSYFNQEALGRIKQVLTYDKINEQELLLKRQLAGNFWKMEDTIKDKKLAGSYKQYCSHGSLTFKGWIDSLNYEIASRNIARLSLVRTSLINLIGNALLYEFAPLLEHLYFDPKYENVKESIQLVLARFQYKDFEIQVLNKINTQIKEKGKDDSYVFYEWKKKLLYLSTQKSLSIYAIFLKTTMTIPCDISLEHSGHVNLGYDILDKLCGIIKNLPAKKYFDEEVKRIAELDKKNPYFTGFPTFCEWIKIYPTDILDTSYEWMMKNVGKYEIISRSNHQYLY